MPSPKNERKPSHVHRNGQKPDGGIVLRDVERPFSKDLELIRGKDQVLVNKVFLLGFDLISQHPLERERDTIVVLRDRSIPIKIMWNMEGIMYPDTETPGVLGSVFIATDPIRNFCVGKNYFVSVLPRTPEDMSLQRIKLRISATRDINLVTVPGKINYRQLIEDSASARRRPLSLREPPHIKA